MNEMNDAENRFILLTADYEEAVGEKLVYEQSLDGHLAELLALLDEGGMAAVAAGRDEWEAPHLVGYDDDDRVVALFSLMHNVLGGALASVSIRSLDGSSIILIERETDENAFPEECYEIACLNRDALRWRSLDYAPSGELNGFIAWEDLPRRDLATPVVLDRQTD